jgi:hypothetical protein
MTVSKDDLTKDEKGAGQLMIHGPGGKGGTVSSRAASHLTATLMGAFYISVSANVENWKERDLPLVVASVRHRSPAILVSVFLSLFRTIALFISPSFIDF